MQIKLLTCYFTRHEFLIIITHNHVNRLVWLVIASNQWISQWKKLNKVFYFSFWFQWLREWKEASLHDVAGIGGFLLLRFHFNIFPHRLSTPIFPPFIFTFCIISFIFLSCVQSPTPFLLGWKLSHVAFYHQLTLQNTTWLSFQPNWLQVLGWKLSPVVFCY